MASKAAFTGLLGFLAFDIVAAQLASPCSPNLPNVACVNKYAAVMPLPFARPTSPPTSGNSALNDTFSGTVVPDPSFNIVKNSTFIVFDRERGLPALGPSPSFELVFTTAEVVHEAPVYVPGLNAIIVSQYNKDVLAQQIINLNNTPPTISPFLPSPPVFAVNGGRLFNGTLYWAVAGGDATFNGTKLLQAPGIYAINPWTRESKPVLNNYFGQRFNSPDDLVVDSAGDIFFTDPIYAIALNVTQFQPVLPMQTYRFRPSTGAVSVIESEVGVPNGIALSPDEKILYISDTAVTKFGDQTASTIPRYFYSPTQGRSVWAFDTVETPAGKILANKRVIFTPDEFAEDGLHVARNGLLIGAAGTSVDVLSPYGELILKVHAGFTVINVQFAGKEFDELWLFGIGKIARVKWALKGLEGGRS